MRVFVTGAGGQLGHDVMNNLHARGYEGIGSDIAPVYSGIADGSAVTTMPYIALTLPMLKRCVLSLPRFVRMW